MLKVENLRKVFRTEEIETIALNGVSFEVNEGEFVAIMGPSGCGKSTLLNILGLLDNPTSGSYRLLDREVASLREKERTAFRKGNIGFVFQSFNLIDELNVFENVELPLIYLRVKASERKRRVNEILSRMNISHRAEHFPQQLSGGQQQRVAIARTLAPEPTVLFMDEPLSNLDAKLRLEMRSELQRLHIDTGSTFIYVTHDQTEAMTLGDRIVIMKDGLIQQIGTPQEVFNHPANLFVAGFIGMPQMNFYDAELVLEDGQYAVVLDGAKVTLPEEKQAKLKANGAAAGPITLGVRPEHLILSGDESSMIHGTVDVSEMMGSAVHLHVSACGSDTIMIVPTTELESTSAFTIGSPIAFTFNGAMAHLFDRNTQKNLEWLEK